MIDKNLPILIIGAGSIGERHIKNLWRAGYENLIVYRQRNMPWRDIGEAEVTVVLNWADVIKYKPFAVFICTPTSQHLAQTIACLKNNMHVFVEKPLSHSTAEFDALIQAAKHANKLVQVAYMMRFHPLIKQVKIYIEKNSYGNLISMNTHWGSYLPAWHPYENYKESYAARKELGGGVALTLSHDIDLVNWLAKADVDSYSSVFTSAKSLDINVESVADFLIKYNNAVTAHVHLNYIEKVPRRSYHFIFEHATIDIDYFASEMKITNEQGVEIILAEDFDRNSLFVEEIEYFFNQIEGNKDCVRYALEQIKESEIILNMCKA